MGCTYSDLLCDSPINGVNPSAQRRYSSAVDATRHRFMQKKVKITI